jgi:mono/diheme cytochrome c family protein/plastocyanin
MVSRRSILILAVAALAAVASGCGQNQADLENGKRLFTGQLAQGQGKPSADYQPCGACHALARAGTGGSAGPDLDAAFATARRDGMTAQTVQGVVEDQIAIPRRNSTMPANLVTGADKRDVAAYVASVAGQPGKDQGQLAAIGTVRNTKPITEKNGVLTIPADPTGALAYASTMAIASAGTVEIVMPNPSPLQHDIALQGDGKGPVVGTGGTSRFSATLKPGKYEFLCTVPGHADGGMKGTLTVK